MGLAAHTSAPFSACEALLIPPANGCLLGRCLLPPSPAAAIELKDAA